MSRKAEKWKKDVAENAMDFLWHLLAKTESMRVVVLENALRVDKLVDKK